MVPLRDRNNCKDSTNKVRSSYEIFNNIKAMTIKDLGTEGYCSKVMPEIYVKDSSNKITQQTCLEMEAEKADYTNLI